MDVFRLFRPAVAALLGAGVLLAGCAESDPAAQPGPAPTTVADTVPSRPVFDVRSVTVDARRRPEPDLLPRLHDLGVTHVTLVSFGWQRAADDPQVRIDTSDGWYSESHRGIRALARQADTLGMGVILKPHIWIGGYDDKQDRSEIGFDSPKNWTRWETSYRRFLLLYARLAAEIDADVLVLGTELSSVATSRPQFFRALADTVRTVYDGKLTYAANWHEEYRKIAFWDALDYVGVQAYFPLVDTADPSLDTLRARWRTHRQALAEVHRRTDRPVLLTEVGYRSARTAAAAPWRWPEREDESVPADSALQARCYRAFLSTMRDTPWFTGAVIWKWHPRGAEQDPTAFTPQGKPAERVLYRWFTGTGPDVPVRFGNERSGPAAPSARRSR
jgi:hypothetical protein